MRIQGRAGRAGMSAKRCLRRIWLFNPFFQVSTAWDYGWRVVFLCAVMWELESQV